MLHGVTPIQMQATVFFVNSNNYAVGSIITDSVSLLKKLIIKAIQNNCKIHHFIYYSILPIAMSNYCRLLVLQTRPFRKIYKEYFLETLQVA